jgi:hypothetical protein
MNATVVFQSRNACATAHIVQPQHDLSLKENAATAALPVCVATEYDLDDEQKYHLLLPSSLFCLFVLLPKFICGFP